ncbi:alpha/beta-hydrolase [Microthyrium microscopicum]|uniref:Alpha/beta-hydrolase n=1 Tax=Microthyrium microscopicum TaxID=703497 RepID=A0A6A6UP88_9PEZI|nr:alpha/beta-hydrolase [Microthyrium microscopicum]
MASPDSKDYTIQTTHGTLAITDVGTGSPALLMIHGNSFNKRIFHHILTSPLSKSHRLLAFDLPGHGASTNAPDAERSYSMPGYADAAIEILTKLEIGPVIVLGWSLGGHIAIEMIPKYSPLLGIMIVGSPPVNAGEVNTAFTLASGDDEEGWRSAYAARGDLTEAEMLEYAHVCADPPYEDWMGESVVRTDQRARKLMFEAFATSPELKQRTIVEEEKKVRLTACPLILLDDIPPIPNCHAWSLQLQFQSVSGQFHNIVSPNTFDDSHRRRFLYECDRSHQIR